MDRESKKLRAEADNMKITWIVGGKTFSAFADRYVNLDRDGKAFISFSHKGQKILVDKNSIIEITN